MLSKAINIILQVICYISFSNCVSYSHLCDNVFRQADKLIVKPENYNMVVKDEASFKIFLQNNMDRGIQEISLLADSPAFDFKISPTKMPISKDQRVFFTVTMKPKPKIKSGSYPIKFRLVGGGKEFKNFNLDVQGGETAMITPGIERREIKRRFEKIEDISCLLQVKPVSLPPQLDGAMDDACWKEAAVLSNFSSTKGGKAVSQTLVLITFDKESLYFGIHGEIEEGKKISRMDKVEIRFATSSSGYPYYCISLPGIGLPLVTMSLKEGSTMSYRPEEVKYFLREADDFWTAEVSIPFSVLKIAPPFSKAVWYIRIIRTKTCGMSEISYWSCDPSGYNSEEGFGAFVVVP